MWSKQLLAFPLNWAPILSSTRHSNHNNINNNNSNNNPKDSIILETKTVETAREEVSLIPWKLMATQAASLRTILTFNNRHRLLHSITLAVVLAKTSLNLRSSGLNQAWTIFWVLPLSAKITTKNCIQFLRTPIKWSARSIRTLLMLSTEEVTSQIHPYRRILQNKSTWTPLVIAIAITTTISAILAFLRI